MADEPVTIRPAEPADLDAVNHIITAAVMAWPVSARVKRMAVASLCYDAVDLDELDVLVAERGGERVGVAAWDATTSFPGPHGLRGALFHGLYVHPDAQRSGIGRALRHAVSARAAERSFDGLLVKAERAAVSYFEACGYQRLPEHNGFGVVYPYLYWSRLATP